MNHKTHSLVLSAIGAGLLVVLSQIQLSIGPVPFTLQTLGLGLIASIYRPKEAVASVGLYLLLGAVGLPVFAGFSGGVASLVSPTAGFLWGFLPFALVTAKLTRLTSSPAQVFFATLLGDSLCFLLGFIVFRFVSQASWQDSLNWTILPFILPDLVKIGLVVLCHRLLATPLKKEAYFSK